MKNSKLKNKSMTHITSMSQLYSPQCFAQSLMVKVCLFHKKPLQTEHNEYNLFIFFTLLQNINDIDTHYQMKTIITLTTINKYCE